ncbi:AAA family ATPase [Planobispora rosea]|uniref:AAA family ATPase n=1 Tax=Planobispora rosea TaxID=35762 RepID=UPI000839D937|nr:AAA family ATPase [Planobispora rosea]
MVIDTPEANPVEQAPPRRRGLLGRSLAWVQADHLKRGPHLIAPAAYGLTAGAYALDMPGWYGLPITALATIGSYARQMNLPAAQAATPGRAALATLAAGAWASAAVEVGPAAGPYALMSWLGAGVYGLAYWAYRRDPVIAQAIAWEQAKKDWQWRAIDYGLANSHLLSHAETRLGERFEVATRGTGRRASQLAGPDLEERIAEVEALPASRVKTRPAVIAGRLIISIRYKDPWAQALPHPLLDPTPEIVLPPVADAREPLIVGMDPESGRPLQIVLWDEEGAKRVIIVAMPGSGKTTTLNNVLERLTAADNAFPIGINVSKAKELRRWRPALGASACGARERVRALRLLELAHHVIDYRGAQEDGDEATVEPTPDVPLVPIVIDEMDTLLSYNDNIGQATRREAAFVMNRGRSEGVPVVLVGTRGTAAYTGGGDIRSMVDQVVMGKVNRRSEMQHAAGELGLTLPDMARYGEGKAGVLLVTDMGGHWSTGRGWKTDKLTDIDRLIVGRRPAALEPGLMAYLIEQMGAELVADLLSPVPAAAPPARRTRPVSAQAPLPAAPSPETSMAEHDDPTDRAATQRANAAAALSAAGSTLDTTLSPGQRRALAMERRKQAAAQTEMDPELRALILAMLAAPEGTTTRAIEASMETELGHERGISKSGAWRCLDVLRFEGVAELRGAGRGARWHLAVPAVDAPPASVEQLAEEAAESAADDAIDTAGEHGE